MKLVINPEMILLGREIRGLTQIALAKKLKIAQGTLSKIEYGLKEVTATDVIVGSLSKALGFPRSFFLEKEHIYSPAKVCPRKKVSLPQKIYSRVVARANLIRIHIQKLMKATELEVDVPICNLEEYGGSPAKVAQAIRHSWQVPRGPIKNVTTLLEEVGIFVIHIDFDTNLIDGFTISFKNTPPIIFVNSDLSGDRLRFTLAHELGHVLMHKLPNEQMEEEANIFASELLMPEREIKASLKPLNFEKLASLKKFWGVSMQALLVRASRLEVISKFQERKLWMYFSQKGMRMSEPEELDIPKEEPYLLKEILRIHEAELNLSHKEICSILGVFEEDFKDIYCFENKPKLKRVK